MPAPNTITDMPTLAEALGIGHLGSAATGSQGCGVVAFTGSGGKTTAMLRLASELAARGEHVVITTTTHIYPPDSRQFPVTVVEASLERAVVSVRSALQRHSTVVLAKEFAADGKLVGVDPGWIGQLAKQLHLTHILVEADGSRGRPFKAPAAHEPIIPPAADLVVAVVGLSAVGQALSEEFVHRPERVAELAECRLGDTISPSLVATVMAHPQGSTRGAPAGCRVVALLNQADDESRLQAGHEIACKLIEHVPLSDAGFGLRTRRHGMERVVISALRETMPVRAVMCAAGAGNRPASGEFGDADRREKSLISAIVLAAGEGRRMRSPGHGFAGTPALKLALPLERKSILRRVVEAALASSADEVVVVLGHGAAELEQEVPRDPRVRAVYNRDYAMGQSSSVKAGIQAITSPRGASPACGMQAAIFLLGDQPLIDPQAIEALIGAFRSHGSILLQPSYRGTPGHPVLFSQALFPELLEVTGDQGGRALLARHHGEIEVVELNLEPPIDIDTPKDYAQLVRKFSGLGKL